MDRKPPIFSASGFVFSLALLLPGVSLSATAAEAEGPEIALLVGEAGSDYERVGFSLRFGPQWATDWGNWYASLRPELELSHFRHTGPGEGPGNLNQGGMVGRLHLHHGNSRWRPFAEAGLGVSLFSRDRLGGKDFGSRFQFSQHLALGVELSKRGYAGLQYSHYSNADIEKPNDGIDLHQIVIGARF